MPISVWKDAQLCTYSMRNKNEIREIPFFTYQIDTNLKVWQHTLLVIHTLRMAASVAKCYNTCGRLSSNNHENYRCILLLVQKSHFWKSILQLYVHSYKMHMYKLTYLQQRKTGNIRSAHPWGLCSLHSRVQWYLGTRR